MANETGELIPVAIHGWSPSAYGIWGALLLQLVVGTFFVLRRGPEWIAQWSAARKLGADTERENRASEAALAAAVAQAASEERARIDKRIGGLEDELKRMNSAMGFLMNAALTSANALEAVAPDNAAIHQSRELLAMAVATLGNDDPISRALSRLASVPDSPGPKRSG